MKKLVILISVFLLSFSVMADFTRNNVVKEGRTHVYQPVNHDRAMEIAPAQWGFMASYAWYGSTGFYTFQNGYTYAGQNYLYGYIFNYSSFTNDLRALYLFDVTALGAGSYNFKVDTAIQTNAGTLDVFDAEDFGLETATAFANPNQAFGVAAIPLGSVAIPAGFNAFTPVSVDVSADVTADIGGGLSGFLLALDIAPPNGTYDLWLLADARLEAGNSVPTMNQMGLAFFVLGLIGISIFIIRKK